MSVKTFEKVNELQRYIEDRCDPDNRLYVVYSTVSGQKRWVAAEVRQIQSGRAPRIQVRPLNRYIQWHDALTFARECEGALLYDLEAP